MKNAYKISTLIILFTLIIIGCKKHDCQKPASTLTNAIITGNDLRACACCGGLMITFTNNATTYAEKFYTINQLPSNSGITENSTFPIYVKVKYETVTTGCADHINILTIEKQ